MCQQRAAATVALAVCTCHLQQYDAWRGRTKEHEPEQRHGLQHRFQQHQRHARQPLQNLRPASVLQMGIRFGHAKGPQTVVSAAASPNRKRSRFWNLVALDVLVLSHRHKRRRAALRYHLNGQACLRM